MTIRTGAHKVVVEPWTARDLDLLRLLNAPEMTTHRGGPETEEQVLWRHQSYLSPGTSLCMFRIVLLPSRDAVGSIGYWTRKWNGQTVYETGWNVLRRYQGRGIATSAAAATLDHARIDHRYRHVHAYPAVHHSASNAICRKAGFTLLGEFDFEYPPGSLVRSNNWRFDLGSQKPDSHGPDSRPPRRLG